MNKLDHPTPNEKFYKWLLIGRPPTRWLREIKMQLHRKGITLETQRDPCRDGKTLHTHGLILFYDSGQEDALDQINVCLEEGYPAVVAADAPDWKETRSYLQKGFIDCISIASRNPLDVEDYANLLRINPNTS